MRSILLAAILVLAAAFAGCKSTELPLAQLLPDLPPAPPPLELSTPMQFKGKHRVVCPDCHHTSYVKGKVRRTGSNAVNGGFRQHWELHFKCPSCKCETSRPLKDTFEPNILAQPVEDPR
jgi:predicted nucleic-acid-binding Zn-ribbon protein